MEGELAWKNVWSTGTEYWRASIDMELFSNLLRIMRQVKKEGAFGI